MKRRRVALVTGSSRGIGREIALALAAEEDIAAVAVHYFRNRTAALDVEELLGRKGKKASVFKADLTKTAQAESLARRVQKTFGRVDILVNNFGPFLIKPWERTTEEDWLRILRGNLLSPHRLLLCLLPGMRRRKWGRVVNIGYHRAEHLGAFRGILPYAAAKIGLHFKFQDQYYLQNWGSAMG